MSRPTTWVAGAATSAAKSGRSAGATGTSRAGYAPPKEPSTSPCRRCVVLGSRSGRPLMSPLGGNSEVLDRLVAELYARGLSTRDVEDAFRDATGELLISKSAVSGITDRLWEDYQAFIARDLAEVQVGVPVRRRGL